MAISFCWGSEGSTVQKGQEGTVSDALQPACALLSQFVTVSVGVQVSFEP